MKRAVPALAILFFLAAAVPSFAVTRTILVVDDVIRMSQAGVGDDEIVAYVHKTREPFEVNADDVIAMTDAHVSRAVIRAVVDEATARRDDARRDERPATRSTTVYVAPAYGYYGSYYNPYYYDPFWYGPRLSLGFGFNIGPRWGGHWGGGHFRHH